MILNQFRGIYLKFLNGKNKNFANYGGSDGKLFFRHFYPEKFGNFVL